MRTLMLSLLALAGAAMHAEDFQPLAQVVRNAWTDSPHLAVVCRYGNSRESVQQLAAAFNGTCHITVVDIHHSEDLGLAGNTLVRLRPDLLVLLPADTFVRDGSYFATVLVRRLNQCGIPSAGTSTMALKQGALFAIGDGTARELLVNEKQIGTIGPVRFNSLRSTPRLGVLNLDGSPILSVVPAK